MKDLTIITVCTHRPTASYYCFDAFLKSLKQEPLYILDREYTNYSGLGSKPKGLFRAIHEGAINTRFTLFVDCWDLFFAQPIENVLQKWFPMNCDIVISAEKNCFPADLKDEYDKLSNEKYRYLNSGMILGETDAIYEALVSMELKNVPEDYRREDGSMCHINDQELWQHVYLKQPVNITLDTQQNICQTLHDINIDEFEFLPEGIKNKVTGTYPSIFHANGSAKDSGVKEPILKYLNLL